jgi:hypothetical protein
MGYMRYHFMWDGLLQELFEQRTDLDMLDMVVSEGDLHVQTVYIN